MRINGQGESIDIRPAAELADPGPRGAFEPTPARSAEFALNVSGAFLVGDAGDPRVIGPRTRGLRGVGDTGEAQGVGVAQDVGVTE